MNFDFNYEVQNPDLSSSRRADVVFLQMAPQWRGVLRRSHRGSGTLTRAKGEDQGLQSRGMPEDPLGRGAGGAEGAQALVQDLVDGLAKGELGKATTPAAMVLQGIFNFAFQ